MKHLHAMGDESIIFTGFVQGRVLEELYSNARLYVQPSDLEGMSLSLLEAMSYGRCCLISNIAESVEVIMELPPAGDGTGDREREILRHGNRAKDRQHETRQYRNHTDQQHETRQYRNHTDQQRYRLSEWLRRMVSEPHP